MDTTVSFPYSLSEYARKALWLTINATVFRWVPTRVWWWRRLLLRVFGARVAPTCNIFRTVKVRHPWLLEVGEHTTLAEAVEVYNLGPISIGDQTVVSQYAHLCNGTHDYKDPSFPLVRPPMRIGSGVWIAADAFIGPGITIGDNAIVGARAVVMHDVPPDMIVAGNPARVIRERPMPGINAPARGEGGRS